MGIYGHLCFFAVYPIFSFRTPTEYTGDQQYWLYYNGSVTSNFYPGQNADRVSGAVKTVVPGGVSLVLEGPGFPRRSATLPSGGGEFSFDTKGFEYGEAVLSVSAGGETLSKKVRRIAPRSTGHMTLIENGHLVLDGKPIFRRNMYAEYYKGGEAFREKYDADDLCQTRAMVRIAHDRGLAVMSHTNGAQAVLAAVEAGVDSIEHGNFIDGECIAALAESRTCLVPTATVARNAIGRGFGDDDVLRRIYSCSLETIAAAASAGVLLACGSDAGAVGVLHGQGVHDERSCFVEALGSEDAADAVIARGATFVKETFRRK